MPNTQAKEVNLTKRVQTPRGMRYCPVVGFKRPNPSRRRPRKRPALSAIPKDPTTLSGGKRVGASDGPWARTPKMLPPVANVGRLNSEH